MYMLFVHRLSYNKQCIARPPKALSSRFTEESVSTAYRSMLKILRLPPVQLLMLLLATWKFPFAVADQVAPLKLQDLGVKKEHT